MRIQFAAHSRAAREQVKRACRRPPSIARLPLALGAWTILLAFTLAKAKAPIPDIRDSYGVAVADFDNDGLSDVYLVGFRTLNRLLINDGDGTFHDKSIAAGVGGNLMPQGIRNLELGASAVDFDNDGSVDLLICGWGEALDLLKNRGDGTFYSVARRMGLKRDVDANMGIWGDLDRDGWPDLLLTNEQGPPRLYRNDHGLNMVPMSLDSAGIAPDAGSQGALWCDLDLDGDLDLIITGWNLPLAIYEQTAAFHFRPVPLGFALPPGTRCNAALPGDFDNDGDPDLLVTVRQGPNLLLQNQADPPRLAARPADWRPVSREGSEGEAPRKPIAFREIARERGLADTLDSYGGAFGDFDGDGDLDLFITTRRGDHYYRNEEGRFAARDLSASGMEDEASTYNTGFAFGDLTPSPGDEMVVASRDSASAILDGPPPLRRRLKVVVRGVKSNAGGVGSQLTLWARRPGSGAEEWALIGSAEIHGGEGYLSSYVGPAAFYLPDSTELRVRVRFPSGKVAARRVADGDSALEIRENGFLAAAWENGARAAYHGLRDPVRRKSILYFLGAVIAVAALLRAVLKAMAAGIARKRYTRELVAKNAELEALIREVERTQQQLIHSEKLAGLGQLVAGIAHELNNPIGFIYANLYQIRKYLDGLSGGPLDDKARATLGKIDQALRESQEGSQRVRDIVQNLRGLSRAGSAAPGVALRTRPCDFNRLIEKSLLLAQTAYSKNISVEKDYGDIPPVAADETQIQQVFLNILVNAGQALGEKGRIRIRTRAEAGKAVASIRDDGPGIRPDDLKRVFDPFFTTKPVGQGIGLGLHICYQIMQAHHGDIEAFSEPGQGAEFRVTLPLDAPSGRAD